MPKLVQDVLKELKKKHFAPLYLLHGDEPFFIDKVTDFIEENALPVADRSFNQYILYGKDLTVPSLLSYAKRFPMMSERQLILVKEAQGIQGIEQKEMQAALEAYAKNPLPSTVLVLAFKDSVDERRTWVKAFDQQGILMSSKKMYDNKIPDWIIDYCHESGVKISPKAVQMILENVGNDLKRIASEIDKIIINLKVNEEINASVVERFVGISKEYNYFEFQKSLIQKDVLKANQIVNFFASNPKDNPLAPIILLLFNFFSKVLLAHTTSDKSEKNLAAVLGVNPFFVKDYIQTLRHYSLPKVVQIIHEIKEIELQAKGIDSVSSPDSEKLKELTFKILH
jgi:DNA polymerase-3 subunit delta